MSSVPSQEVPSQEVPPISQRGWWVLALVATAELFGMSLWFTASALGGHFGELWGLGTGQIGALTTAVQVGFVAGTALAAISNIADLVPSRPYFATSVVLASVANLSLLVANDFGTALVGRFLVGFFLAGVYPPGMKMVATWFREGRGLAIGTVVGALTVGKATPYLLRAFPDVGAQGVVFAASAAALVAALLVAMLYREGPYRFERRPFSWRLVGTVWSHRPTRLATLGYLGHMWELYAMWTWIPAFVAASVAGRGGVETQGADLVAFGAIAAGGLGCVWGGRVADRVGRERLASWVLAASGACCLGVGLLFGASLWLLAPVVWFWGFFVVADSAQFSALVTEVAPAHAVGTALTLQTSLGFLLTTATIQLVPKIVEIAGWPWAFVGLALGPALGIVAMGRLARERS